MMATVHATAPHTLPSPAMYFPPRRSSSTLEPRTVSFEDSRRPCVELHKPVWVVDYDCHEAVVTGEIEVNTSVFPRGAPFAIGVELKSPADSTWGSEWNHDGPNGRPGSFIQLGQRLAVDESAFTTITLSIPRALLPAPQHGRVFILSCCAFLLDDPRIKSETAVAKFMVVRRAPSSCAPSPLEIAPCSTGPENEGAPKPTDAHTPRTWMGKRRVGGAWGKVAKW